MPLVRYEVRCEHSLADPALYRTSVRDDSEGLLEGVAMAGLVGLVRQLGDLAEYVWLWILTPSLADFRFRVCDCCVENVRSAYVKSSCLK